MMWEGGLQDQSLLLLADSEGLLGTAALSRSWL